MSEAYAGWAILEIMGHRKLAGFVSEVTIFGQQLIQIDIPTTLDGDGMTRQIYPPSALFGLSECAEDLARAYAVTNPPKVVSGWELGERAMSVRLLEPGDEEDYDDLPV